MAFSFRFYLQTEMEEQPVEQEQIGPTGTVEEQTIVEDTGSSGPPPPEETQPQGPSYLITLDDLLNEQSIIQQREHRDRSELGKIENPPNVAQLRQILLQWAKQGFPYAFPLFSITLSSLSVCSDGVTRTLYPYIEYLMEESITSLMAKLEVKLQGIKLLNSYSGTTITIHVYKP